VSRIKPPFPYYGGKQRIAEKIVSTFPEHGHYIEPFAGGLSVLLAKPESKHETVNDLDARLVTFWRVLRNRPEELYNACLLTPWSRTEQSEALDMGGADDLEVARRVFVLLTQGRGARIDKTGWRFVVDPKSPTSMGRYRDGYTSRIMQVADRIHRVVLESRDALEVIGTYDRAGALMYVDPPYLAETRSSLGYGVEMADAKSHAALAESLNAAKAHVCLSGYDSDLYRDLYPNWNRVEIKARANVGDRIEVLWVNY
jgi:DNA adenine methylase